MRITENNKNSIRKKMNSGVEYLRNIKRPAKWVAGGLCLGAIILASIYFGMTLHQTGKAHVLKQVYYAKFDTVTNFLKGITASPKRISIDIKHLDYLQLVHKRDTAFVNKVLLTSAADYVPARIVCQGVARDARIRLKGDWMDHCETDKWSFRIKVKGGETFLGMRRFSIQHPKVRAYINEWILFRALAMENVIVPRYEFVEIVLNGKNLGIYALEEHFDKILVENNRRRVGPIVKFNEDVLWSDRAALKDLTGMQINFESEFFADIDAFNMGSISKNPELYKEFILAKDLLESFRRGNLTAHKVFDVEKMAAYFAISQTMAALHGAGVWNNLRFYYNPITSLLEPIGFDGMAGGDLRGVWDGFPAMVAEELPGTFHDELFRDPVFLEEFIKELDKVSKKPFLDELFSKIGVELEENLKIIYSEFPYYHFSKDVFYSNQELIQKFINVDKKIYVYFSQVKKDRIELVLGNMRALPVEILGLDYGGTRLPPMHEKNILFQRIPSKLVDYQKVSFLLPKDFQRKNIVVQDLKVKYRLLGQDKVRYENVIPYSDLSDNFIKNDFIRRNSNVRDFKFLFVNEKDKKIFIRPGKWRLNRNLIVPAGYKIICKEAVELDLTNSAKILSFSPLNFFGTEDYPIRIYSSDSTGQGVAVMKNTQKSVFEHVIFEGLSNPSHGNWSLLGAVTFYEAPVEINYCRFLNNNSEDALNIVRSDFSIRGSLFSKTFSDALDSDFCSGKITETSFVNSGNDAIDVSGSLIELKDIFIDHAGDKGISAGEESRVRVEEIEVRDTKIAFASKDMSVLEVRGGSITGSGTGFAIYQKKPEFGPAEINAFDIEMKDVGVKYLVEKGSKLKIDNKEIISNRENVTDELSNVRV